MRDVSFVNLMMRRIYNVLIVANPYDAFMLEHDGRVEEKIYNEYTRLGLRYPPTFTQVSTIEEAWAIYNRYKGMTGASIPTSRVSSARSTIILSVMRRPRRVWSRWRSHTFRILIDGQKQGGLVALDEADLPKDE